MKRKCSGNADSGKQGKGAQGQEIVHVSRNNMRCMLRQGPNLVLMEKAVSLKYTCPADETRAGTFQNLSALWDGCDSAAKVGDMIACGYERHR